MIYFDDKIIFYHSQDLVPVVDGVVVDSIGHFSVSNQISV